MQNHEKMQFNDLSPPQKEGPGRLMPGFEELSGTQPDRTIANDYEILKTRRASIEFLRCVSGVVDGTIKTIYAFSRVRRRAVFAVIGLVTVMGGFALIWKYGVRLNVSNGTTSIFLEVPTKQIG